MNIFFKFSKYYSVFKPLIILISALILLKIFPYFKDWIGKVFNILSEDLAFDTSISIFVILLSILFNSFESKIKKSLNIITIEILNEKKQSGDTPILLNRTVVKPKTIFVKITIENLNKKSINENTNFKLIFPKGITVSQENYNDLFFVEENELQVKFQESQINGNGTYKIPISIMLGTNIIFEESVVSIEKNFSKLSKVEFVERNIKVEE